MPIFVLTTRCKANGYLLDDPPWSPWTDAQGFVIVAADEMSARTMAARSDDAVVSGPWWLDPNLTDCEPLSDDATPRIILTDQPTG